jgi:peptide deformylase
MSVLEIVLYPDPFLTKRAREIKPEEIAAGVADGLNLAELIENMKETMYSAEGIGLAAPQVRVGLRLFVVDISKEHNDFRAFLNPTLNDMHGSVVEEEGCLSIPHVRAKVKRFETLKIKAVDLKGQPIEYDANELFARVCQHEYDHIDGKLFINRLGMASRMLLRKGLAELEEDYELQQAKKKREKK